MSPVWSRARGFTLIELMVVLVIMSLLVTLIMPSVASGLRRDEVRTTRDKLCEVLDFAYMSAVTRHRPVVVNLDARRALCWVSVSAVSLPWLDERPGPKTATLATMALPKDMQVTVTHGEESALGVTPTQAWKTVTFRGDGRAENVIIELTDVQGKRAAIEVVGVTGEVHAREEGR